MESKKVNSLNITLKDKEIDSFKSVMEKCEEKDKQIGFQKDTFNEDEMKLIKDINKSVNK